MNKSMTIIQSLPMTGKTFASRNLSSVVDADEILKTCLGPDGHKSTTSTTKQNICLVNFVNDVVNGDDVSAKILVTNSHLASVLPITLLRSVNYIVLRPTIEDYSELADKMIGEFEFRATIPKSTYLSWVRDYHRYYTSMQFNPMDVEVVELDKDETVYDYIVSNLS